MSTACITLTIILTLRKTSLTKVWQQLSSLGADQSEPAPPVTADTGGASEQYTRTTTGRFPRLARFAGSPQY